MAAGALVLSGVSSDPTATPWPEEFVINFQSNITTDVQTPVFPVNGVSYYDWTIKSQRIEHSAGAYECTHFYNTDLPCTLFFLPDGLYRVLSQPLPEGQEECCLDLPGIGASPPDWASRTNPSYNGVVTDEYSQFDAYKWTFDTFPNTDNPHLYYEVAPGTEYEGRPLVFTFPDVEGRQDYHYDPKSMVVAPQDDSLFALPEGCAGRLCNAESKRKYFLKV